MIISSSTISCNLSELCFFLFFNIVLLLHDEKFLKRCDAMLEVYRQTSTVALLLESMFLLYVYCCEIIHLDILKGLDVKSTIQSYFC